MQGRPLQHDYTQLENTKITFEKRGRQQFIEDSYIRSSQENNNANHARSSRSTENDPASYVQPNLKYTKRDAYINQWSRYSTDGSPESPDQEL